MTRIPLLAAVLLAGGCASRPAPAPAPPAVAAAAPPPVPAPPPPPPAAPLPVYRNPRIGMVLLRAHQDAQGRLLGPQVMYQVVDPGGWNLEALDHPPAPPPAAGIIVTGRMRPEERALAEAEAARRGPGWAALFDPQAGWLLLPPSEPGAK